MNREHSQEPERAAQASNPRGETGQPPVPPNIPRRSFLRLLGLTIPAALASSAEALGQTPTHVDIKTTAPHKDIGHYDHGGPGNNHTDIKHGDTNGHTDGTARGVHIDRPHTDAPHQDMAHTDAGGHIDIGHDDANNFTDHTDIP